MADALHIALGRRYRFAASHRLHSDKLSEKENHRVYGKCNNPYGHGHNYTLEVRVSGAVDPATGMIANLPDLDAFVDQAVIEPFDHRSLQDEQAPMGARRNTACDRISRIHLQAFRAGNFVGERIGVGEHETRHSVGERRLTYALRAADQPGVWNSPASIGVEQGYFRVTMTEQGGGFAGMRNQVLRFGLPRAHAGLATLPALLTRSRSPSAAQMFAATASGSPLASISRHRSGSAAAMRR